MTRHRSEATKRYWGHVKATKRYQGLSSLKEARKSYGRYVRARNGYRREANRAKAEGRLGDYATLKALFNDVVQTQRVHEGYIATSEWDYFTGESPD